MPHFSQRSSLFPAGSSMGSGRTPSRCPVRVCHIYRFVLSLGASRVRLLRSPAFDRCCDPGPQQALGHRWDRSILLTAYVRGERFGEESGSGVPARPEVEEGVQQATGPAPTTEAAALNALQARVPAALADKARHPRRHAHDARPGPLPEADAGHRPGAGRASLTGPASRRRGAPSLGAAPRSASPRRPATRGARPASFAPFPLRGRARPARRPSSG